MRCARRSDWSPRIEIMPLIDVIFLLLTFFIYAMVTMVQAQVLPVGLTTLSTGKQAEPGDYAAITIDQSGQKYFNREKISDSALRRRLEKIAEAEEPPSLVLAMAVNESGAAVSPRAKEPGRAGEPRPATQPVIDRGPMLIQLIEQVRQAGVRDFVILGQPRNQPAN